MIRFEVQALARQGYKGCSRAGRFWPSEGPVEVVVYDQPEDPKPEGETTIHTESPRRIGQKTFEQLKADKRLRIINAGDPMAVESETVAKLKAQFDGWHKNAKLAHEAELERQEDRHAEKALELQAEIDRLRQQLEAQAVELDEKVKAKTDELHAQLQAETARAEEAEKEAISLMEKLEQMQQSSAPSSSDAPAAAKKSKKGAAAAE